MGHAHCMMDTKGYKHTLRISTDNCFSTETMVARTPVSVTLYVYCLPCLGYNTRKINFARPQRRMGDWSYNSTHSSPRRKTQPVVSYNNPTPPYLSSSTLPLSNRWQQKIHHECNAKCLTVDIRGLNLCTKKNSK